MILSNGTNDDCLSLLEVYLKRLQCVFYESRVGPFLISNF